MVLFPPLNVSIQKFEGSTPSRFPFPRGGISPGQREVLTSLDPEILATRALESMVSVVVLGIVVIVGIVIIIVVFVITCLFVLPAGPLVLEARPYLSISPEVATHVPAQHASSDGVNQVHVGVGGGVSSSSSGGGGGGGSSSSSRKGRSRSVRAAREQETAVAGAGAELAGAGTGCDGCSGGSREDV